MDRSSPTPPWHLSGRAAIKLHSRRSIQIFVQYDNSPVGPYLEYAIMTLTRLGPSVTFMEVDSETSRLAGRRLWGFPKTLAHLSVSTGRTGNFNFHRPGATFHVHPVGPQVPVKLSAFTVQTKHGQAVKVPCEVKAQARLAFSGPTLSIYLTNFDLTVHEVAISPSISARD